MSYYKRSRQGFDKQYSLTQKIMDYGMGFIYLTVGTFILFAKTIGYNLSFPPSPIHYFFGGLIIVYGLFRIYRALKK